MSVGEIAALVAAGAAVVLVVFLAVALVKFGRTMDEATASGLQLCDVCVAMFRRQPKAH